MHVSVCASFKIKQGKEMTVEREYQVPFETKLPLFGDGTGFQKNRKG